MSAFEKGREKTGGIKKGTKQSYSNAVRDALQRISVDYITGEGVKSLKADLDSMRPIDRAQTQEKYLKYWLPTMGTVSVTGQTDGEPIEIKVTYSKAAESIDDEDDEDIDYSEEV